MNSLSKKKFMLNLSELLEKHKVRIDNSKTYTSGIAIELDCGGLFVNLPEQETITAEDCQKAADLIPPIYPKD